MTEQQTPTMKQIGESMTDDNLIARIFTEARTHKAFLDRPVEESTLRQLYETAKFAPSASNLCPMRISFVTSAEAKQAVITAVADGNKPKVESAPVVAIIAHDSRFHDHIGTLAPHMDADAYAAQDASRLEAVAIENSWLQAGFLISAARALGLDCGPMSGFSKPAIDDAFYAGSSWKSDFLMNIGYGDETKLHPRGARLSFEQACEIL
ncbi:MAG: malonic semialdehyde reductase [Alphaproteobacteria bacterium]